jgi:hypothetical protein
MLYRACASGITLHIPANASSHRPARARQNPRVFCTDRFSGSSRSAASHQAHAPAQSWKRAHAIAASCCTAASFG